MIPASAPGVFKRRQYREATTSGPNALPKPAHANATNPRIEFDGLIDSKAAMMATPTTAVRDRLISTWSESLRLVTIMYKSSINALDVTSNCDEIVDMMAANTAVSTNPATSGWNKIRPMSRKTVS